MTRQFRPQAPDIQGPERLGSPGSPEAAFSGAARPVIDHQLANVADALGAFNTNLTQFGTAAQKYYAHQQQQTEQAWLNREILGRTPEQWLGDTHSGALPAPQNPIIRGAMDKYTGMTLGDQIGQQFSSDVKSGVINLLDPKVQVDSVITKMVQDRIANYDGQGNAWRYANNPYALAGLRGKVDALREAAIKKQSDAQAEDFYKQQFGVGYRELNSVFDTPNISQEQVQQVIREKYHALGSMNPKSGMQIPPQVLDKAMIDVARTRASDPNTAAAALYALTAERADINGNKLPPLAANPRYAQDIVKIETTARGQLANRYISDTKNVATDSALDALEKKDGSFWTLTDTERKNVFKRVGDPQENFIVKAEEARREAVIKFLNKSEQEGGTPIERFEREYDVMSSNNVTHPVWKETLTNAARALTDPSSLTDPAKRQQAQAAGELFMTLSERNYPYVKTLLGGDKEATDLWTVYRAARTGLGLNGDRALDMAAAAIRQPESEHDAAVRTQRAKEVADKVTGMDWGQGWKYYFPFVNDTSKNVSGVQKRVLDIASVLVRVNGLTLDDAVKASMQAVSERSMVINGHLVPDTSGMPTQAQKPYIEKLLGTAFKTYGEEWGVDSPNQLYIKPAGGGNFTVWVDDQLGGHPAFVTHGEKTVPAIIKGQGTTANSISKLMEDDRSFAAIQAQAAQEKARDEALINIDDGFLDDKSKVRKQQIIQQLEGNRTAALERMGERAPAAFGGSQAKGYDVVPVLNGIKNAAMNAVDLLHKLAEHGRRNGELAKKQLPAPPWINGMP